MLFFSHLKIRAFERETVVPELLRLFGRQLGVGERTAKKSGVSGMGGSACKNLI